MNHRFIEFEDRDCTNLGKFSICQYTDRDRSTSSAVVDKPLLASLPPTRRFQGSITPASLWLLDLQTQEGMLFDPNADLAALRQRFLVHPIHVCVLYFPAMRYLSSNKARIFDLPDKVTLDLDAVLDQPGFLVGSDGRRVMTRLEWSQRRSLGRPPITCRLRNREVGGDPEEDQEILTAAEITEFTGPHPTWEAP